MIGTEKHRAALSIFKASLVETRALIPVDEINDDALELLLVLGLLSQSELLVEELAALLVNEV